MMTKHFRALLLTMSIVAPYVALGAPAPTDFKGFVALITNFIGVLVILVFTLTFIAFIWGLIKGWIINVGDAEGIQSGKNVVVVGVIALTIMVSIWGILAMLKLSLFGN